VIHLSSPLLTLFHWGLSSVLRVDTLVTPPRSVPLFIPPSSEIRTSFSAQSPLSFFFPSPSFLADWDVCRAESPQKHPCERMTKIQFFHISLVRPSRGFPLGPLRFLDIRFCQSPMSSPREQTHFFKHFPVNEEPSPSDPPLLSFPC